MITIRVNGKEYSGWIAATVQKDIDNLCGTFSFTATGYDFPIKIQDKCEIFVNGVKFLTGFVEKRQASGSASDYTITISGRDKLSLLVDNTVEEAYQYIGGQSLSSFCQNVISDLGLDIKVIAKANPTIPVDDLPSCEIDTTAFELIDDVCKRLQVIATSNEDGNLVLMHPRTDSYPTAIVNKFSSEDNNVLNYSYNEDYTNRFYQYNIYSADNFALGGPLEAEDKVYDIISEAFDNAINHKRKLNVVMNNSYNETQADKYAKYTANIRRVDSISYSTTMILHQGTSDGRIWEHNILYNINDDYAGINTKMLCKGITYSYSNEGETTSLDFVVQDAYKVQASKPFEDRSYLGNIGLGGFNIEK